MRRWVLWILGAAVGVVLLAAPAGAQVSVGVGVAVPGVGASVVVGAPPVYAPPRPTLTPTIFPPTPHYPYLPCRPTIRPCVLSRSPRYYYARTGTVHGYWPLRPAPYYGAGPGAVSLSCSAARPTTFAAHPRAAGRR